MRESIPLIPRFAQRARAGVLLLFMASMLCADEAKPTKASTPATNPPTRIALVTGVRSLDALNALALAQTQLASSEGVVLLERDSINRLLEEHELTLSGIADPATAIRISRILTADLLGVLEGDPKAKKQKSLGLVVFDARSGARLWDQTLPMDTEQASSAIRSSVEAATAKYRAAPNVKKTISVVAVRNVDLPASRETFCRGIGRLLERRLVGSPNVTLLERHSLERVRRERAVSPEAPANALLASLQMVELEIARDGDDRLKATAILTTPDKKKRRATATAAKNSPQVLVAALASEVLRQLDAAVSTIKPNLAADAKRMMAEARHEWCLRHHDQGPVLAEAAMALAPEDTSMWLTAANIYTYSSVNAFDPVQARSIGTLFRAACQTEESRTTALRSAIRAVELYTGYYGQKNRTDRITSFSMKYEPHCHCFDLASLVRILDLAPGGHNEQTQRLMATLRSRYENLMLNVLLPHFRRAWRKDGFRAKHLQPYMVILATCWKYLPASSQWTDVMVEHGEQVMDYADRRGIAAATCRDATVTHVYPLAVIIASHPKASWGLNRNDYERLDRLFEKMECHRLPGIQTFGKVGQLCIEQALGHYSKEQAYKRCREIFDFAKKAIEHPNSKQVNRQRLACYEAAFAAINSVNFRPTDRGHLLNDLLEFMTRRREASLGAIRLLTYSPTKSHANYTMSWSKHGSIWRARTLWRRPETRDLAKVNQLTKQLRDLLAAGRLRCLDGRKREIRRALDLALEQHGRIDPRLRPTRELLPVPGVCHKLFDLADCPRQGGYLSKPIVRGDSVYVAGLFNSLGKKTKKVLLFRISLDNRKVETIHDVDLPNPPETARTGKIYMLTMESIRRRFSIRLIGSEHDDLYYAVPHGGGILVFPLDGSSSRRILTSTTPGMPTDTIDHAVLTDGNIFALTSSIHPETRSYVHWCDPTGTGWQVIASSTRAEKKTPLDRSQFYIAGATYDADRRRVLFIANLKTLQSGLYQFNTETKKLKQLKRCCRHGPLWCGQVSTNRMWFAFRPPMRKRMGTANLIEFNMRADKWREVARWKDATKASRYVDGLKSTTRRIPEAWNVYPPFAEVDGWIWSFHPLARFTPDGRLYQEFEDPLRSKSQNPRKTRATFLTGLVPTSYTLEHLPKRRALLYSNRNTICYIQLPDKPDRPPTKKPLKNHRHRKSRAKTSSKAKKAA